MRLAITVGAVWLCGCAGIASGERRGALLQDEATTAFEGQGLWGRPLETSVDLGAQIKGEASSVSILFGLITIGPTGSHAGNPLAFFADLAGGDELVQSAAGEAALNSHADGIYVTHHEVSGTNILWLFTTRKAVVTGRALHLKVIGPVAEDRVDRIRALQAIRQGPIVLPTTVVPGINLLEKK